MNETTDWHAEIYLTTCSHYHLKVGDSMIWCIDCNDWVDGEVVGDVQVKLEENGEVVVWGGGWIVADK